MHALLFVRVILPSAATAAAAAWRSFPIFHLNPRHEGALPVNAEAAIYLMQDENRMDVLKCLISGPADVLGKSETPYALGLFEFHIFIPPDYPQVSPLVNLQTTGDGLVRFNPNLYSDGKVWLRLMVRVRVRVRVS